MRWLALLASLAVASAACGDDATNPGNPDGGPVDGTPPDGMPGVATLTSFVIDLVANQTSASSEPVAFAKFEALPDPDGDANKTTAYATLFQ